MSLPTSKFSSSNDDPIRRLHDASDALYAAFADVAFDGSMFRDPTVTDDDLRAIAGPVRDLPPDRVGRFVMKAGTTWGGPDDLRRIAPRAVELAAAQQLPIDRGLLWAKLRWADWRHWPAEQTAALTAFLHAEWGALLRTDPRPAHVAHRWLRHAANGIDDLAPFLDDWHAALGATTPAVHHRAVTGHLVLLLCNSPLRPDHPDTLRDLFPGHEASAVTTADWLAGPDTLFELERSAALLADTFDARRVQVAVDRLRRFRARVHGSSVGTPTHARRW